jgi:hypothetical protein
LTRKQRDYKAEYARRIARAKEKGYSRAVARGHARKGEAGIRAARFLGIPVGSDIDGVVAKDKRRVFGRKIPRRAPGEGPLEYEERLTEEKQRPERQFKWTSQDEFIESLIALGLTEREAYTHWFS